MNLPRNMLVRVVPLFGKSDNFVTIPQAAVDSLSKELAIGGVQVVVVEVICEDGRSEYLTWGYKAEPKTEAGANAVGIPVLLMNQLGLEKNDQVTVRFRLGGGQRAKGIFVSPASVDDSEIVEHNAARLEDHILRQMRVVYVGLVFPIFVRDGIHVLMKVDKIDAPTPPTYVILDSGSELFVATKSRPPPAAAPTDEAPPPLPSLLTVRAAATDAASPGELSLYVHPSLFRQNNWGTDTATSRVLPCVAASAVADAAAAARRAKSSAGLTGAAVVTQAALRRRAFDVVVRPCVGVADLGLSECLCSSNFNVILGARLLIDPEIESSGVHPDMLRDEASAPLQKAAAPDTLCAQAHPEAWAEVTQQLRHVFTGADGLAARTFKQPGRGSLHGLQSSTLVCGAAGSGKTVFLEAVRARLAVYHTSFDPKATLDAFLHADASEGAAKKTKSAVLLEALEAAVLDASVNAPAVLLIDNVDALVKNTAAGAGGGGAGGGDASADMLSSVFTAAASSAAQNGSLLTRVADEAAAAASASPQGSFAARGVTIVATCRSVETVRPSVLRLFSSVVKLALPNQEQRRGIVKARLAVEGYTVNRGEDGKDHAVSLVKLARETSNYTPDDLATLVAKAVHFAKLRGGEGRVISADDMAQARDAYTPAALVGVDGRKKDNGGGSGGSGGEPSGGASAAQGWKAVGGMAAAKKTFNEVVILPTQYPELYRNMPVKMRSGILLYGPTGCGKTHVVKAAVAEAGINHIDVAGPELLSKYIGQSEQKVREVFDQAAAAAPCVLFFDEFDSVAPQRGHDNTGVTDRVVNQLLCHLDGAEGRSGVYVVAATARPDMIDKALLRPGRLDAAVYCGMPTRDERLSVLETASAHLSLAPDVDLSAVADLTEGLTHADLAALLSTARLRCVQGALDTSSMLAAMNIDSTAPAGAAEGEEEEEEEAGWAHYNVPAKQKEELATYVADIGLVGGKSGGGGGGGGGGAAKVEAPVITQATLLKALQESRPSISKRDAEKNEARYASYQESRSGGSKKRSTGQRTTMA